MLFDYRSFDKSFWNLFGLLLRDFEYGALYEASPKYADFFFVSYMTVVGLIMMNLWVAILCNFYDSNQADDIWTEMAGLRVHWPASHHATPMGMQQIALRLDDHQMTHARGALMCAVGRE